MRSTDSPNFNNSIYTQHASCPMKILLFFFFGPFKAGFQRHCITTAGMMKQKKPSRLLGSLHHFAFDVKCGSDEAVAFHLELQRQNQNSRSSSRNLLPVAHVRDTAGPGVIVQLEFSSSPPGGATTACHGHSGKRWTKNYIFHLCVASHSGTSLLGSVRMNLKESGAASTPTDVKLLLQAQWSPG